jgi:hypothetical protein
LRMVGSLRWSFDSMGMLRKIEAGWKREFKKKGWPSTVAGPRELRHYTRGTPIYAPPSVLIFLERVDVVVISIVF